MSLLEDLRSAQAVKHNGPNCGVRVLLDSLGQDDRESLEAALALTKDQLQHATIAEHLRDTGLVPPGRKPLESDTISRHRRGICGCRAD